MHSITVSQTDDVGNQRHLANPRMPSIIQYSRLGRSRKRPNHCAAFGFRWSYFVWTNCLSNCARMRASSKTQVSLGADVRVGCRIVRLWFRGEHDRCKHSLSECGHWRKYSADYPIGDHRGQHRCPDSAHDACTHYASAPSPNGVVLYGIERFIDSEDGRGPRYRHFAAVGVL